MNDSRTSFLGHLVTGATAGALGGAYVGVVEVLLLCSLKGSPRDLEALLYAVIAYGALGFLGGLGLGLLGGLWCVWRKPGWARASFWAAYATLVFAPPMLFVMRYRVNRDALGENPTYTGGAIGLLVLFITLFLVALLSLTWWYALRQTARSRFRDGLTRPLGSLGLYALVVVVAALLSYGPALAASLQGGSSGPAGIPPDLREEPNVVFIMVDTLRADRLSCYGYTDNQTPHVDSLARDGIRYTQMGAQASWTKPSVATQLTSLYPSSHQAIRKPDLLPSDVLMLPEVLQERGYRTAGFANNVNVAPTFNFDQGYDEYVFLEPSYHFFASESSSQLAVYQGLRQINERFLVRGKYPQYFYQPAEVVNDHVLRWLETNKDSRFFLFVHYMDPHDPYFAHPFDGQGLARVADPNPDPSQAGVISNLYDGEVTYLDDHLGDLIDYLKAQGLYDDALIVLTGDHGEEFYEHGGWWHGTTLYEEQLAVPLIIKYPGGAHAGVVDDELARSLDLAPTILDVAGLAVPEVFQGLSLLPDTDTPRAEVIFAEEDHEGNVLQSIRTAHRKLVVANEDNPRGLPSVELFDLRVDPGEENNLAAGEPDTVQLLRAALDRIVAFAEASAVAGQTGELDAATRERLRQLGY